MTPKQFIQAVARTARDIQALRLTDKDGAFSRALAELHRDAGDYQQKPWATPDRAVEVIVEEVRVLVHEANVAGIEQSQIGALIMLCVEAVASGVITDPHHAEFFAGVHPARN